MKQIFVLLFTALALFACNNPEYKITGSIEGAVDGDTVLLGYSSNGVDFTTVSKSIIENGEFHFQGKQDGCKIYYIGYENGEVPIYALFFLEGGDIKADIGTNYSNIVGSPMNDLNIEIEEKLESYVMKMLNYQDILYRDSTLTAEEKAELDNKNFVAQNEAMAYVQDAIRENINNMMGLFLLVQYSDLFDNKELAELLAAVPEENRDSDNNPLYEILLETQEYRNSPGTIDEIINSIEEDGANVENYDNSEIVE